VSRDYRAIVPAVGRSRQCATIGTMKSPSARQDANDLVGAALRDAKAALRTRVLALRDALPEDARASASRAIAARIQARPDYGAANCVLVTLPFRNEWDTVALVRSALAAGKAVAMPRVDPNARMLDLHAIADLARDVGPGVRNIPEPLSHCPTIAREAIDFVVVPGVAFDRNGRRLGYGGGYYDRLLPLLRTGAARVAGAFDLQLVDRVPAGPNDIGIDAVITESRALLMER
jgi:5-formyltetrahydrofolate cyclo-ligase